MPYKAPSAGHPLGGKIRTGQREYMDLEGYRADLAFLDGLKPSLIPGSTAQDAWARAFEETLRNLARVVKSLCTTLDELTAAIGGMPDGPARSEAISYRDELKKCKDEGVITLADGCKVHEESDGNPSGGPRRWPPDAPPKVPPTTK